MGPENPMLGELTDEEAFGEAVKHFQWMAGLQITGEYMVYHIFLL